MIDVNKICRDGVKRQGGDVKLAILERKKIGLESASIW